MAYIDQIWVHDPSDDNPCMLVIIKMQPHGTVRIPVKLPPKFLEALIAVAQTAADAHEAMARAEILGDTLPEIKKTT